MIKNGEFCIYNGNEYELNEDNDGNLIIITTNREIIDATFVDEYNSGVYSKIILPNEIQEAYECRTYGLINGYKVSIRKELKDTFFVGTGDRKIADILGLNRTDKYLYEKEIAKDKIEVVQEKKKIEVWLNQNNAYCMGKLEKWWIEGNKMKILGKIAIYKGTEYEFRKKTDGSYALYTQCAVGTKIQYDNER